MTAIALALASSFQQQLVAIMLARDVQLPQPLVPNRGVDALGLRDGAVHDVVERP
jgi:hypothetical protein